MDSQLASSQAISGVRELLNGCICCNLVGQLSDALLQLRAENAPDRIVIETSGSAFPATLAMEINRVARENEGAFVLDGVISVIDVENWKGYEDTSYTAKMQAKYTDLIVFNKWELVDERRFDECLDRVGDLDLQVAWVKSNKGRVDQSLLMGIDGALISKVGVSAAAHQDGSNHGHSHDHQEEVEVLSVSLGNTESENGAIDLEALEEFLLAAPKDEIYRIKGIIMASKPPADSTGETRSSSVEGTQSYILNWAFGRWNYTHLLSDSEKPAPDAALRLTVILARGEGDKWEKRMSVGGLIKFEHQTDSQHHLTVKRLN